MPNDVRFRATIDDKVSGPLDKIRDRFDRIGGKGASASLFGNLGAKAIAGGFGLIGSAADKASEFLGDSVDAFSRLQQSAGAIESVFGQAAGPIEKFAETAATKAGLAKAAVFEMASVIGASLTGMGLDVNTAATTVVELEQRAADMAATFGGTTREAIEAMGSALRGERDPIERYGVSIKEADVQARILELGLANVTAEEKKQAVATATLDLIMSGTAKTAGQFAREADTLAGKQSVANAKLEDAQAALGERLAPIMTNFTSFLITDAIPAIEAFGRGVAKAGAFIDDMANRLGRGAKKATDFLVALRLIERINDEKTPGWGLNKSGGTGKGHKAFAEGGWAGMTGPETITVGDGGEPELIIPASKIGGAGGAGDGGGVRIVGVSEAQLVDLIERGLYFRLQRAAPTGGRV